MSRRIKQVKAASSLSPAGAICPASEFVGQFAAIQLKRVLG